MTPAEQLAILRAFVASRPEVYLVDDEPYDGPTPDPLDGWSDRDLDALGDRRADGGFR